MKITVKLLARLGLLPLLAFLSVASAYAQTDIGKTVLEKLTARVAKFESACAKDIKKYCKTVTPGEGRMIYCMQAHEDKISPRFRQRLPHGPAQPAAAAGDQRAFTVQAKLVEEGHGTRFRDYCVHLDEPVL